MRKVVDSKMFREKKLNFFFFILRYLRIEINQFTLTQLIRDIIKRADSMAHAWLSSGANAIRLDCFNPWYELKRSILGIRISMATRKCMPLSETTLIVSHGQRAEFPMRRPWKINTDAWNEL